MISQSDTYLPLTLSFNMCHNKQIIKSETRIALDIALDPLEDSENKIRAICAIVTIKAACTTAGHTDAVDNIIDEINKNNNVSYLTYAWWMP